MADTPKFAEPPIVEMVLGGQFAPLAKLTSAHYGLFWQELGDEWVRPIDGPVLEEQFESFEPAGLVSPIGIQLQLGPVRSPGRIMIGHKSHSRLVQVQATRFHLNWRKLDHGEVYLSYSRMIAEFETLFDRFTRFVNKHDLGTVDLNQWEITYIDSFPKGDYWTSAADWSNFLPGLFSNLFPTSDLDIDLQYRAAEWGYEIKPKRGRLRVSAQTGQVHDDKRESLILQMTARGPVGPDGVKSLREGLDLGHKSALDVFMRVTSEEAKAKWRPS